MEGEDKVDPKTKRIALQRFKEDLINERGVKYTYSSNKGRILNFTGVPQIESLLKNLREGGEGIDQYVGNELTPQRLTVHVAAETQQTIASSEFIYELTGQVVIGQYNGTGLPTAAQVFSTFQGNISANDMNVRVPYQWDNITVFRRWCFSIGSGSRGTAALSLTQDDEYELRKIYGQSLGVNEEFLTNMGNIFIAWIGDVVTAPLLAPNLTFGSELVFTC